MSRTAEAHPQAAPQGQGIEKPAAAFEPDFVPARGAFIAAAGLLGGVVVSALLVWGMFLAFEHLDPAAPVPPLLATPLEPPGPKLETTALGDRPLLDARAALELSRARWLDAAHSRARVPIERAMELQAARGWPDREGER